MRLLLDAMIAARVAEQLIERGIDAVPIDGSAQHVALPDAEVLAMAQRERRTIVTENVRHFRPLAERAIAAGDGHFGVLFIARTRHGVGALISGLEAAAARYPGDDDMRNRELWL